MISSGEAANKNLISFTVLLILSLFLYCLVKRFWSKQVTERSDNTLTIFESKSLLSTSSLHTTKSPFHLFPSIIQSVSTWIRNFAYKATLPLRGIERNTSPKTLEEEHINPPFRVTHHTEFINGIPIAYCNPSSIREIKGIALLIHGCGEEAKDWFQLPEHRHIAAQLVRRKLALLAVSSSNKVNGCWSTRFPSAKNEDAERVTIGVKQWTLKHNILPNAPIYAIGVSSGATMLSVLSSSHMLPNIVSQALYISPGNQRAFRNASDSYPNTIFVHLTSDQHFASSSAITSARKVLLNQKVKLVGELPLKKVELTPLTIHQREPRISPRLSKRIFNVVREHLGTSSNRMEKAVLVSSNEDLLTLWADKEARRAVRQVFRVTEGQHELSAVYSDKVVDWLIRNGRK